MFFAIPLELKERVPSNIVPWGNCLLIAANIALYLLNLMFGWHWAVGPGSGFASLLLYSFSHAGFWHLAFNLVTLWVFGNAVNRRIGNGHYLLGFLGTILAIGIFARLLIRAPLLGASGGVFAVMIMCFMLLPRARVTVGYIVAFPATLLFGIVQRPKYALHWLLRWGEFSVLALWGLLLVPMMEFWALVWSGWGWTPLAHLLGMLCGLVVVLFLPPRISMRQAVNSSY